MPNDADLNKTTALLQHFKKLAELMGDSPDRLLAASLIFTGFNADGALSVLPPEYPLDTLFHPEEWSRMLKAVEDLNKLFAPYRA